MSIKAFLKTPRSCSAPGGHRAEEIKMHFLSLPPTVVLQLTLVSVLQGAKWTYEGSEGQQYWEKHYPYCGGTFQSPIDIESELLRFDPTLRPVELQNYNLPPYEQLTLGNNGHSLQLSLPPKMYISSLRHRYTAAQLHFHWGSTSQPTGSEHMVNSKQYAAELHVVHYNSDKYPNISKAVDKSDGLAVLGVFIEIGAFNPAFESFLKFINGIKYRDQKVQVPGFNIRDLLPSRLDEYYRYDGSLTTPPCYPSVLWTVFRNSVTVSQKQFQTLATALYSTSTQDSSSLSLHNNYRNPQPADSRVVLMSFKEDDLSWMNTGLLVLILVSSVLGFAAIVSLMCCLLRQKRSAAEQSERKSVEYGDGDRDEYGSRV